MEQRATEEETHESYAKLDAHIDLAHEIYKGLAQEAGLGDLVK